MALQSLAVSRVLQTSERPLLLPAALVRDHLPHLKRSEHRLPVKVSFILNGQQQTEHDGSAICSSNGYTGCISGLGSVLKQYLGCTITKYDVRSSNTLAVHLTAALQPTGTLAAPICIDQEPHQNTPRAGSSSRLPGRSSSPQSPPAATANGRILQQPAAPGLTASHPGGSQTRATTAGGTRLWLLTQATVLDLRHNWITKARSYFLEHTRAGSWQRELWTVLGLPLGGLQTPNMLPAHTV